MANEKAANALERAADLIDRPNGWTQEVFARDATGMPISFISKDATCFCIRGALARVSSEYTSDRAEELLERVLPRDINAEDRGSIVTRWNDTTGRTQAEVVAKLREAAALLKAEGVIRHGE